jgi:FAD/FMN-containing dehydrogenase
MGATRAPSRPHRPAAVVFAESTRDVQDAVRLAAQHNVPVIPYAAGSSLEGHLLAVQGGISIDVNRMNRVLSVNAEDLTVTVQPGITRKQLNDSIKDTGLFFPSTPAPTPASAAWPPRAPAAPTPCATAPCARTCWR